MGLENLKQIVESSASRTSEARNRNKLKNSPSSWRKVWEDALRKHYPHAVVAYTDRCAHNLKRAVSHRNFPVEDMPKFLEWIVERWHVLRMTVFSFNPKVPRGPEAPDMGFVIVNLPRLHAEFNAQKPEHAATRIMPASRLAADNGAKAVPTTPIAPTAKPAPATTPAGYSRGPLRPLSIDHAKAVAAQKRLGIKSWEDKDGGAD
jgi:hypothetical protein